MISAITINYNGFEDTCTCINSLQKAYNFDQIVVVDNPVIRNDSRLKKLEDPNIHIIYNDKNVGFGAANNIGIQWLLEHTSSSYILLINNDARVDEDAIDTLLKEDDKYSGILTPKIFFEDNPQKVWYGGGVMDWKRGIPKVYKSTHNEYNRRYVTFASGCALLIKREVLCEVGGFDERYFMYEEDVDFCLRILKAGYKIKYIAESTVYHKVNASLNNNGGRLFFLKYRVRNCIMNVIAHASLSEKIFFLFFFSAKSVYNIVKFIFKGNFKAAKIYFSSICNGIARGWDKKRGSNEDFKFKLSHNFYTINKK